MEEAIDIASRAVPFVKELVAKKELSSADMSVLLFYDMSNRLGAIGQRLAEVAKELHAAKRGQHSKSSPYFA